ncbi:hypothetical protein SAMN05192534_12823 [Alteribacillus persepolensis]|uniref:YfhD-like protein n=1 Tax=Alteribacillus persepolensis TaxID=568899 RepID=A0A1G8J2H0_9BACI|nr:hypothetical protein [Alteribacillus persepolensis]SDI25321.1 hypothetical protein SAMN05192534_12823 [Alteribacillus persepolensis]
MAHRENKNRQDKKNRGLNRENRKRNHQQELQVDNRQTEFASESEFQDDLDNLNNRDIREDNCSDC